MKYKHAYVGVAGILVSRCGKFIMAEMKSSLLFKGLRTLTVGVTFEVYVKK